MMDRTGKGLFKGRIVNPAVPAYGLRQLTEDEIARFLRDGFLCIRDLTSPDDIGTLREVIDRVFRSNRKPFGVVDNVLKAVPSLRQSRTFQSCHSIAKQLSGFAARLSFDQAIYKRPHELYGTQWHQDQAFRTRFLPLNTLHFWIPLQSVTEENGCLHFIPRSHCRGLRRHYRVRESDPYAITTNEVDDAQAVPCPMSVGSATLHLPMTLHRALPNNTESIRRAWALLFRPFGRAGGLNPIPYLTQFWNFRPSTPR